MDSAAWVPCECGEWWCMIHGAHASECDCPPVDELDFDPYTEGFTDDEESKRSQDGQFLPCG